MTVGEKNIQKEIIESFSSAEFNDVVELRQQALASLNKIGLPTKKSEEYRFTPITTALEKNFNWNTHATSSSLNSIDEFLIPGLEATVIVFVNGIFSKQLSKIDDLQSQIEIAALSEALQSKGDLIRSYFEKNAVSKDSFSLLNSAFYREGVFVHVPGNTTVAKPLHIVHVCDSRFEQVIAHTKLLVIVGDNSKLTVIESFHSVGDQPIFTTFMEQIVVGENANLQYVKIQNDANSHQVANSFIQQVSSSRVDTFTLTLDGKLVRNNFSIELDGEKCESHFHGLYLLKGNSLVDNHTVVDHKQPDSFSNELYKGVMGENSKGVFNGKIFVRPHAQKTNAFQSNRNILLDDTATINTKPQLEIWADDVKCSHGCTTGQLDEEALFYLRSRGIPQAEAKALLLHAFVAETYNNVENEPVKNFIEKLISERLAFS